MDDESLKQKKRPVQGESSRSADQIYGSLVDRLKKLENEYGEIEEKIRKRKEMRDLHPDELEEFIGDMQRRLHQIDQSIKETRVQLEKRMVDLQALKFLYRETEKLTADVEVRLAHLESRAAGGGSGESMHTLKNDVTSLMEELKAIRSRREALSKAIEKMEQKML